ncbi:MAG: hypothetical protein FWH57_02430 [Oscillospiraceae bacterium]|nr:hypothetical protein [Oscillospiraceae bacterium]
MKKAIIIITICMTSVLIFSSCGKRNAEKLEQAQQDAEKISALESAYTKLTEDTIILNSRRYNRV